MNRSALSSLTRLRPKVIHSVPGRLRLRLPAAGGDEIESVGLDDIETYFTNRDGIHDIAYDGRSGTALITYDPGEITEEIILRAVKRLTRAVVKVAARIALLSPEKRTLALEALRAHLVSHPVDLRSENPVEVPREIWR